jgi:PKD repeat protein
MWDPNAASGNKVWAGGVTGGLWYNNDITSSSSQWVAVNDFWDNISITSIAYDPNNTQTFYVGTGEGWGAGAARGAGIWKSTDGGSTWSQISSTTSFYYVNDLVVRNESGSSVVYAACRGNYYEGQWHGSASNGLQRSTNGGTSWTQVLPNVPSQSITFAAADIELGANNRIWVGTTTSSYGATDRGGGRVLYSDNGTSWTISHTVTSGERVELACAPGNSNYVYAMTEVGNQVGEIARTTNDGTSWSTVNEPNDADNGIPSTDFSRGQAWYDLILAVDPNDENTVLAGGIDLFRTTDGGTNWSQISKWSNNNNLAGLSCSEVHADQHAIAFKPNSSSTVIFGNDGGVYHTTSLSTSATNNVINNRNNGYNVTQYYACAIHPTGAANYYLAGSQDNGTQKYSSSGMNSTTEATGGDGAWCFIDQTDPTYQITSYVYNSYWRSTNGGTSWGSRIQSDQNTGKFINPADYDDELDILYSSRTTTTINRISGISGSYSVDNFTVSGMSSEASHLRVSPYTTTSTTLFVGTDAGDLYKVTNANTASPSSSSIGSGSFPSGSVSCVEIGASENELLVTFSNYGVTSVWYTSNGGSTWVSKEGNLPDMPVRWALFNPNDRNEVLLATEVGVWTTSNVSASSPSWSASNSGLANVRVDMLQIRDSDNQVIAATHGRGLFSSDAFAVPAAPVANFGLSSNFPCLNQTVNLFDSTTGVPTSWTWTISPSTYTFLNGTNANSQNPEVQFTATGSYDITLNVSNSIGVSNVTVNNATTVGGLSLPFSEDFEGGSNDFIINNPDGDITWSPYTVGGTSPGNTAMGVDFVNYSSTGQRDDLISLGLNFTGYSNVTLDFEYAYRRYNNTYRDSMAIFVSTDCGVTYTRVASYNSDAGTSFATGADQTSNFSPSVASDWCGNSFIPSCPNIDLSAYAGLADVFIKFQSINGYGNNLYIDNINVTGTTLSAPTADFSVSATSPCVNTSVMLSDLSTNSPTSWSWSITPNTFNYINGTSASSQNPEVEFTAGGNYNIDLTATNGAGSDTESKTNVVNAGASVTPTASISANANNVCSGTSISFTASTTNEGTTPSYQWKVNGSNVGSNSNTYTSSTLANGDAVTLELTSNANCVSSATVTSNTVNMIINPTVTPTATISASATNICLGDSVHFTVATTNEGTAPSYQWKVNGSNVGSNSNTFYSTTLSNADVVSLELTSNANCAVSPISSNNISMQVSTPLTPAVTISTPSTTICQGSSVTFSSSVTNGGMAPSYQWKVNGSNVGSNSNTYTSSTLANGDAVTLELTSNANCVSTATVSSNVVNMIINPAVTPTASISANANNVCSGTSISFTASTTNEGTTPSYQWKVNGSNVGSNSNTYTSSALANGDAVTLELTSNANCASSATVTSNTVNTIINPTVTPTATISASATNICLGDSVHFTVATTNEGTTPSYQWKVNGSNVGSNSNTFYSTTLSNADVVSLELTSNANCAVSPISSNNISMQVSTPLTPAVAISTPSVTICQGASITFSSSVTNGGTAPSYQWKVNGSNISGATTANFTTSSLAHGDMVSLEISSNASCVSTSSANSNSITMTVNPPVVPTVSIQTTDSTICVGSSAFFTAIATNEGPNPTYQWKVNGSNVGSNLAFYNANNLNNNDVVSVEVISSINCASSTPVASSPLSISVVPLPVVDITTPLPIGALCPGDTILLTATYNSFGRMGISGNWVGPGVQGNQFIASLAGPGMHTITHGYTYLNSPICSGSDTIVINVDNIVTPTITQNGNILSCNQNGFSYLWFLNGTPAPGTNNAQTYMFNQNGLYTVQIGTASCSASSNTLLVNVGLDELKSRLGFEVYPNPARDVIQVNFENPGGATAIISLYDFKGALVYSQMSPANDKVEQSIPLDELATGIYMLQVQCADVLLTEKIEKY